MRLSKKWDRFGTSIFSVMTETANRAGAVNLAQGFPDFDGPDVIKDAAARAMHEGFNQYAPSAGLPALRTKIGERFAKTSGLVYDPASEITVFTGCTEALFVAMLALLEPGDEVISFDPSFDCYPAGAHAAGARLVGVPLVPGTWALDADALRRAVTPKSRALILNTPHNPTGRVFDATELRAVRDVAVDNDLIVVTDEVYEEIVFDGVRHETIATLPGMRERTIVLSSTSKTYSLTGWKVGYALAPKALTTALRAVHQFSVFCTATPLQAGMLAALSLGDEYYRELRRDYIAKRDMLLGILRDAGFACATPEGTYFIMADYATIKDIGDFEFCKWLTETVKVAAIPVSVFYQDQARAEDLRYARFAFCKGDATMAKAAERLRALKA